MEYVNFKESNWSISPTSQFGPANIVALVDLATLTLHPEGTILKFRAGSKLIWNQNEKRLDYDKHDLL